MELTNERNKPDFSAVILTASMEMFSTISSKNEILVHLLRNSESWLLIVLKGLWKRKNPERRDYIEFQGLGVV